MQLAVFVKSDLVSLKLICLLINMHYVKHSTCLTNKCFYFASESYHMIFYLMMFFLVGFNDSYVHSCLRNKASNTSSLT